MPQGALINPQGFDLQSAFDCQYGVQGDTGLGSAGKDGAIWLGSPDQEITEELSGLAVQLVAAVDMLVSGHLCVPFREASDLCRPEGPTVVIARISRKQAVKCGFS
jgi:hypothetical protein